ncbi:hypothetical protein H072_5588 [Dactylellina haptotyla CBS 200.50]|uniref:GAT domain-containing protein n=1 Tax=Dactylellina haptotyla (strain CBS 200.50) TaxID=1284197 RepID=S8BYV8_DACHA|nr:hypothetical protein H072_5588 [Dactylellina haptotyla CBS 200.50]
MKKFQDLIRPKAGRSDYQDTGADTPEANVARAIRAFCEAGKGKQNGSTAPGPEGIDSTPQVDEVTFLPTIVECTESGPSAAKEALVTIRKLLEYHSKSGYRQYNALMLLRILVDNPGATFTKNIDAKFVTTVKELYRATKDPSVRQLLVETLEYFLRKDDPNLQPVKDFYIKEKENAARIYGQVPGSSRNAMGMLIGSATPPPSHGQHRRHKNTLPPPQELASRISEAQTSAKLLMQILQSTPASEILSNQLITEFADRCSAASRSIQLFIEADNPAPDESTMLTLFETNEQLATSLSRHQLALFSAKKQLKEDGSRSSSTNQVPQLSPSPQPEAPLMPAAPGATTMGPVPEPISTGPSYGFSGFRPSPGPPSPPLAETLRYQPSPVDKHAPENPFSDPEPNWRAQPSEGYTGGRYSPSPVEQTPVGHQERHPMADSTPGSAQQMPHGYQPYRY